MSAAVVKIAANARRREKRTGKVHLNANGSSTKAACGELIPPTRIMVAPAVWVFLPREAQCGRCAALLATMAAHGPWATKEMCFAVECALLGIRRELDQWNGKHRCYSRMSSVLDPLQCSCGSLPTCITILSTIALEVRFGQLFNERHDLRWHARPGTSITRVER